MDKYLYVEMINNYNAVITMDYNLDVPVEKRIVKIKLTDEQSKQLEPKVIGYSNDKPEYENIKLICIQNE